MGIEAKYQAVILARSKGGTDARDGRGDNSNQLLCYCPNELPRKKDAVVSERGLGRG